MPPKPLVLVAEDDEPLRELLEISLSDQFRLILAEDGLKALQYAQTESPDLIVMDIKMPRVNGWDAIRAIRSMGIEVPIIVITGFSDTWDEQVALKFGVDHYLRKPFRMIGLIELIKKELAGITKDSAKAKH